MQLLDVCEVRYPEFAVNVTLDGVCHVSVHTVTHRLTDLHGSEVAVETALCKHIGLVPPARALPVQVIMAFASTNGYQTSSCAL